MPKDYQASDEDMDASMYGGAPAEAPADETPKESVDDENAGSQTAIVSNKVLSPDGEPINDGDEIVVRVLKNYGDESEIKYAPKGGAETTEEPSTPAEDFAAMDTEKA